MCQLRKVIEHGWPEKRENLSKDIREFWNYRDELCEIDGIVMKGAKIVIPKEMRPRQLELLHQGHFGREKTLSRARDVIFWPNMSKDIFNVVDGCKTCRKYRRSQTKEPMIASKIPDYPWQHLNMDLIFWNRKNYLLVTDYYSRWIETAELSNLSCFCVVNKLKIIFSKFGIPEKVRSDSGTHFTGPEMRTLAKDWNFEHVTSSPYHHQSNGLAERSVQTIKRILSKARDSNADPLLGLMDHRNTPLEHVKLSPAQLLLSRRLRSTTPTTVEQLKPTTVNYDHLKRTMQRVKNRQKERYDRNSRELCEIKTGDKVRIQEAIGDKTWTPGKIVDHSETPRK
jgi:hypothetical protein